MSIYVVFIGGYNSSQPDMDLWKTSAQQQRSDVTFCAYPFPANGGASRNGAVQGFDKQFDDVVQNIDNSGADAIFIVGHSSGCAIADEINSRVKSDHKKITLVDLDGFSPLPDQVKGSTVQVWSAEGTGGKGKSVNWAKGHKIYFSPSATKEWSLHFSLVNTAATNAITHDNYKSKGYAGCMANLCFLPKKP